MVQYVFVVQLLSMDSWKELQSPKPKWRWEPMQCATISGSFEIHGVAQKCGLKRNFNIDSPMIHGGKWSIVLCLADRGTDWIGIYLKPHSKSTSAHLHATLKVGDYNIATYDMHKVHDFAPDQDADWGEKCFCLMDKISQNEDLKKDDTMVVEYVITEFPNAYLTWPLDLRPSLQSHCDVMAAMFNDVETADVCFVIRHPHMSRSGPEYIYAHTKVLATRSEYFKTIFASDFAEGTHVSKNLNETGGSSEQAWEERSDSDYEDDLEPEDGNDACDDSTLVDNTRIFPELVIVPEDPHTDNDARVMENKTARRQKVVYISDFSYRTYKALLYFLYTGCIAFSPLTSTYRAERNEGQSSDAEHTFKPRSAFNDERAFIISPDGDLGEIEWTSPKSMYKLCDKLGIAHLKAASAQSIKGFLTPENVVTEFWSSFSSLFPDILKMQEEYIESHWAEVRESKGFEAFLDGLFTKWPATQSKIWLTLIKRKLREVDVENPMEAKRQKVC